MEQLRLVTAVLKYFTSNVKNMTRYRIRKTHLINWQTFDEEIAEINNFYLQRRRDAEPLNSRKARAVIEFLNQDEFTAEEELFLREISSTVERGAIQGLPAVLRTFRHEYSGLLASWRKSLWRDGMFHEYDYSIMGINDLYKGLVERNFLNDE